MLVIPWITVQSVKPFIGQRRIAYNKVIKTWRSGS